MAIFFDDFRRSHEPTSAGRDLADDGLIAALLDCEHRARSLRLEMFDPNEINDSSWLLLQDLFAAHLNGEKMRTKELCATSGLPQTTALRYLDHLQMLDLVCRESDAEDSRVTLVSATPTCALRMREYYTKVIRTEQRLRKVHQGLFSFRDPQPERSATPHAPRPK